LKTRNDPAAGALEVDATLAGGFARIVVQLGPDWEPVTVPAGTRVKQVSFKEDIAFIQIYGHASLGQLRRASESE